MPHRRAFLKSAAATALPRVETNEEKAVNPPGLIMREIEPANLETPPEALTSAITASDVFFVRSHFARPTIDAAGHRLKVEGAVERPLSLSMDEIRGRAAQTREVTLECAGNGRVYLTPKVKGVNWQNGAVGNARWTGAPLADVLNAAKVKSTAVEVVLEGADTGTINDEPKSPGVIHFARSLPLEKARKPEVLLAYRMNDVDLTPAHGGPLRAIVGGWYGMASVKWLTRIIVVEQPFEGFWQTLDYSYFGHENGLPVLRPITAMQPKSLILKPHAGERVPAGSTCAIVGRAWAGEPAVAKVELSFDGGSSWQPARLTEESKPHVWTAWEFDWRVPAKAGVASICARATDASGRTQSLTRESDRRTYMVSHVLPVNVDVVGSERR